MHHANLLVGTLEEAESHLRSVCNGLGIKSLNNYPDLFIFKANVFGIDEARELRSLSIRKAISGQAGKKIFFITSMRLTLEAQNALLKTFEDPSPDTFFFLVVREESSIVPTLRSRMRISHVSGGATSPSAEAEKFIASTIKNRLLLAKEFTEDLSAGGKNLPAFLNDLLLVLRERGRDKKVLEDVCRIRRCVSDYVSLPRLAIEHLSLVL